MSTRTDQPPSAHPRAGANQDIPSVELMDGLVQVSYAVIGLLNRVAAAHDLSLTQLRVLAILRDREPKISDLATHLGLERSSVSGLVDRAVTRGLVRRRAGDEDAREVRVRLTAKGQRLAGLLTVEVDALLGELTGRLGPVDRRRLSGLLGQLLR